MLEEAILLLGAMTFQVLNLIRSRRILIIFITLIFSITVMATTISVDEGTRDQLKKLGEKGDSYDDIVKQLIDQYIESRYQKLEEDKEDFETLE